MNEREEGKGMRLLRKGKRGLIQAIFSRLGLIVLLFLLQLALLLGLFSAAAEFLPHFFGGTIVFNAIIVIYLLNSEGDPTAKLTWLVFFSVAPVFGALFYLYTKSDIGHRLLRERTTQLIREGRSDLRAHASAQQHLEECDPQIARMASGASGAISIIDILPLSFVAIVLDLKSHCRLGRNSQLRANAPVIRNGNSGNSRNADPFQCFRQFPQHIHKIAHILVT